MHGDNLKNWPVEERKLIEDKIHQHIMRCQHPRCVMVRSTRPKYTAVRDNLDALY